MDNILEVKKLRISFRTINGTVKAVRDISFDLKRGETLAIVGESGSGKSVTNKAILGISAGNAIIDSGEILYDGKDLIKISEEDMCKIRGDKISMIFQDPLSSLDPIVKIGRQITEAMIIKNKAARKMARKEFNSLLEVLKEYMIESTSEDKNAEISELTSTFDKFCIKANEFETSYNASHVAAEEIIALIEDYEFKAERKQKLDVSGPVNAILKKLAIVKDEFFVKGDFEKLNALNLKLKEVSKLKVIETPIPNSNATFFKVPDEVINALNELKDEINSLLNVTDTPNFFRIGYYALENPNEVLANQDTKELNDKCLDFLNAKFMNKFLVYVQSGIKYSYNLSIDGHKKVLEELKALKEYFAKAEFTKSDALNKIKEFEPVLNESINKLDIIKDSVALTFIRSLQTSVKRYFANKLSNEKEEKRFARQTAKHDALIARGKTVDWKVVPMKYIDLNDQIEDIITSINRLESKYVNDVENPITDFESESIKLIDFFKETASKVVYKVTQIIAKEKAIKLMEEVGIAEPRIRYYQYPFEFSGGMRQRIVIAIALSANPDILICDEPTTALDVTIQSQILELINDLKKKRNLSVIFITHDLGVVANMADRIAVMYAGKIVEIGTSEEVFYSPAHPYTWALLSSMPDLDTKEKLEAIPGTPPNMIYPPVGDAFAPRNKYALKIDFEAEPPLFKITDTHYAATWLLHPDAPKVDMPKIISDRIERMKKANMATEGGSDNE